MFNLTSRLQRLFSWIKTNQHSHSNLIVQEQLGSVVHQVIVGHSSVDTASNNESGQANDESNITTSFNLLSDHTNLNTSPPTSTIHNAGSSINTTNQHIVENSPMQYQPPSSLSLTTNTNPNANTNSSNVNNLVTNQPSSSRHNRRHRRNRRHRSSRSHSSHHMNNASTNMSSIPSNSSNYSLNLFSSKRAERNILSASCAVFCIAILAVSLVEIRWFYLNGGGCNVNYIGVAHFFAPGRLEYQLEMSKVDRSREITVYKFILPNGLVLENCANREIMLIMRAMIAFVFLAIFSSCIGLILDTFGCMKSGVKLIRRHGVFHILTVIFCLIINGFCFWISEKMYEQQNETRAKKGKKIDISFDISYYLVVLASGLSILATACTLIRRYPTDEDEQLERLLEEYTGFEEPIQLERSLPAVVQPSNPFNGMSQSMILNNILNNGVRANDLNNYVLTRHSSRPQRTPPPPPATPPPPLHVTINNPRRNSNSEPPPPYDPTPAIA